MSLKLPYIKGRPMVVAKLRKDDGPARYFEFLIDSGADYSLISRYDAALLDISYKELQQPEVKVEVANLTWIHTKKIVLLLTLNGYELRVPILIAREYVEALLGRKGVFEYLDMLFEERKELVTFSHETRLML